MPPDVSKIPDRFAYLRTAVARYGHLGHHEVILDFLSRKTTADTDILRRVAEAVAHNDDMDAIDRWIKKIAKNNRGRRLGEAVNNTLALAGELGFSVSPNYFAMPLDEAQHRIRLKWAQMRTPCSWLASRTRSLLAFEEGRQLIVDCIRRSRRWYTQQSPLALYDFSASANLVLIHQLWKSITTKKLPTEEWGVLAALSNLDASLVKLWLSEGPPLSFIALDGLRACYHYDSEPLKQNRPKLHDASFGKELKQELTEHLSRCESPLERRRTEIILRHVNEIVASPDVKDDDLLTSS